MPVILNRYKGDHFENGTSCDRCGRQASVYTFQVTHNILPPTDVMNVCLACLGIAWSELNAAVLADATKGEEVEK